MDFETSSKSLFRSELVPSPFLQLKLVASFFFWIKTYFYQKESEKLCLNNNNNINKISLITFPPTLQHDTPGKVKFKWSKNAP